MAEFTLDTSGVVPWLAANGDPIVVGGYRWPDLTPLHQGYIRAAFNDLLSGFSRYERLTTLAGFSDLAPSALERILKDCEACVRLNGPAYPSAELGAAFWRQRNAERPSDFNRQGFPPQHVFLNDAGQVDLREAG